MKILFFGLGSIGIRHAKLIKQLYPSYELFAYRTWNGQLNNQELSYITSFNDLQKAYSIKPDVVFITNPTSFHVKTAILAANNNCHLFIEKPLSNSKEGIEELISIVNKKKLISLIGCNMRFHPIILKIKNMLLNKNYGRILNFYVRCGSYLPNWRPQQDYSKSYSARKELGGGVMLDLIHEIDYSQWLFGDFIQINGRRSKLSNLKIETEDFAEMLITTDRNIYGYIQLDYFSIRPERIITIVFENAIIKGDLINNSLYIYFNGKEIIEKVNIDRNYTYKQQLKYFFDCIDKGIKTFNSIEEGYKVLKYVLKI